MVSEQKDMLSFDDARPAETSTVDRYSEPYRKISIVEEVAENGEAILHLNDGRTIEVHGHDAHFFPYEGVLFTEASDAETWVFGEEIVDVQRH